MRVALVHDWLTGLRGGERVLHELALAYPDADLFTLIHVPNSTTAEIEKLRITTSPLSRVPGAGRHYRLMLPAYPWAVGRFDLSAYDLVISCSHAVAKGVRKAPDAVHVCYCLTPMRYVWSQADAYLGRGAMRALAWPLVAALRRYDRKTSTPDRVSRFVAISRAVADRIAEHYGRTASVVHPPVATERIAPSGERPERFYFLLGGFVPYKREDVALDAFRGLDRELVVAGDGPTRKRLEATAPPNVRFVGRLSDEELRGWYQRCRALLYPQEEDFGIAAVEAQAAGRPVIAFGRGGARDTVRPPELAGAGPATGLFFDEQTPAALRDAIFQFERIEADFDPHGIRRWALRFSADRFRAELAAEVQAAVESARRSGPA